MPSLLNRLPTTRLRAAPPSPEQPLLVVQQLQIAYGGSVVVDDLSLEALPGQVVCVLGRNGAGKTTLLKTIVGMMRPRAGSICYQGEDITRWPAYARARAGIGYVPQGRGIFPHLSVLENLQTGLEPVGGRDEGQLEEVFTLFPVLKQMAGRPAGLLSGGQQQQLAVGRALAGRPKLLLLDEPTEGIQPSIVDEIEEVIRSLTGKMTIILIEQFLDFALAVAGRCYVLSSGQVVMSGRPDELDSAQLQEYLAV